MKDRQGFEIQEDGTVTTSLKDKQNWEDEYENLWNNNKLDDMYCNIAFISLLLKEREKEIIEECINL